MGEVFIGTSGWHYKHWLGPFYPEGTSSADMLEFYRHRFDTVEINNSFYRLPTDTMFDAWKKRTPPHFRFALKGSRFLTHMKKLKDPEQGIREYFSGANRLGKKLGSIVFQLPPFWKKNPERLAAFLKALPPKSGSLRHRYAFEFRNATWHDPDILEILRSHNAAFCIFDLGGFQSPVEVTADFVYVRLHGPSKTKYQGRYSLAALRRWAERIEEWRAGNKDVFVYFDNDQKGYAPMDAARLRELVGVKNRA